MEMNAAGIRRGHFTVGSSHAQSLPVPKFLPPTTTIIRSILRVSGLAEVIWLSGLRTEATEWKQPRFEF